MSSLLTFLRGDQRFFLGFIVNEVYLIDSKII